VCPYARFQSVLLDSNSLLVGYDASRGEPRGKLERGPERTKGDCIDCGLCVQVCPTGIDIRNGLQLECIQCALCADACDSVMQKIHRPLGLIRYATESALRGQPQKVLRARVGLYAALLIIISVAFVGMLNGRATADLKVLRGKEAAYTIAADGQISNHMQINISNKTVEPEAYLVTLIAPTDLSMIVPVNPFTVGPGQIGKLPIFLTFKRESLTGGKAEATIEVSSKTFKRQLTIGLLGPG